MADEDQASLRSLLAAEKIHLPDALTALEHAARQTEAVREGAGFFFWLSTLGDTAGTVRTLSGQVAGAKRTLEAAQARTAAAEAAAEQAEARRAKALAREQLDAAALDAARRAVAAGADARDLASAAVAISESGLPPAALARAIVELGGLKQVADRERARAEKATAAAAAAEARHRAELVALEAVERRRKRLDAEIAEAVRLALGAAKGAFVSAVAGLVPAAAHAAEKTVAGAATAAQEAVATVRDEATGTICLAAARALEATEAATAAAQQVGTAATAATEALRPAAALGAIAEAEARELQHLGEAVRARSDRLALLGFALADFEEAGPDGAPRLRLRHPQAVALAAALLAGDVRERGDASLPFVEGVASWASITLRQAVARLSALADADPRPPLDAPASAPEGQPSAAAADVGAEGGRRA